MNKSDLYNNTIKMLELKTIELKLEIASLLVEDVVTYYLEVVCKRKNMTSLSQIAYDVFNIKPNIVVEYMNSRQLSDKRISLDDFKEIIEKK